MSDDRDQNQVFLITMHHICSDGWSLVLFFEELSELYAAFSRGLQSPLKELPIQYADYAGWQREWLQGEVLDMQLGYWREKLGGELPVLDLSTDRLRPAVQTYGGARVLLALSEQHTAALEALSQREGATLFMTLLAAFKVLLYRYHGPERSRRGFADCESSPNRNRRSDRFLSQQPGTAHRPQWKSDFSGGAWSRAQDCAGCICASGRPF